MKKILSNEELASLCMELSLLLRAGVNTSESLALLAENGDNQELFRKMAEDAEEGMPLPDILRESGAFPNYMCGLVETSEETGQTAEALATLAEYYESRVQLNRRVRSALLYPAVMLLLMLVVIGVLLVKVLPIFDDVYASLGGSLTGVAGGLLTLGRWLDKLMPVLWALLAVVVVFAAVFAVSESFRNKMGVMWQKSHGDKGISRKLNNARIVQALAMGMAASKPLSEAVKLASDLLDSDGAKARCQRCQDQLEEGAGLSNALNESGIVSANQCRLLEVGQRSGDEIEAMQKIGRDLKEDGEASLDALVSRVEPALVLVCSILVGMILLSVMLPLMHIMASIG